MGSDSDWPVMRAAAEALDEFGVRYEVRRGVGAPHAGKMIDYARRPPTGGSR